MLGLETGVRLGRPRAYGWKQDQLQRQPRHVRDLRALPQGVADMNATTLILIRQADADCEIDEDSSQPGARVGANFYPDAEIAQVAMDRRQLLEAYDALAAELARCRAANVYDAEAHRKAARVENLEAELAGAEGALVDCARINIDVMKRNRELEAALTMIYDKWENGDSSYTEPDTFDGYLGNAFKLSQEEENQVLALIPTTAETAVQSCPICSAIGGHLVSCERWELMGSTAETPVSTLCAICDQIKELHPATHEWTAKETKGDANG